MLDDNQIVSQFDKNFSGSVNEKDVVEKMGVTYHHVSRKTLYFIDKISFN